MVTKRNKKRAITPKGLEEIYGIPRGFSANIRWKKIGPEYHKAGSCRVIYFVEDIEKWIRQNPVLTVDSLEQKD